MYVWTRARATCYRFFFFNDTATTEIYTLSLHDALPISFPSTLVETYHYDNVGNLTSKTDRNNQTIQYAYDPVNRLVRSEEHTSELQSHLNLVCRLLLEKKKVILQCNLEEITITVYVYTM